MVKRKCEHIISGSKRAIYVDAESKEEILEYWHRDPRHRKKFRFLSELIIEGLSKKQQYCKVDINEKCKDVTEMRFFVGQENDRIYCKETKNEKGICIVVAAILHERKKSEDLSATEISLIEKVGGYDYEL